MKKILSRIWYGIIARLFMRNAKVVARSVEAKDFVKKFCKNTDTNVIYHGVNLYKFKADEEKDNSFIVCSQLIERKKIDGTIDYFAKYLNQFDTNFKLYIIGDSELKENLQSKVKFLGILISAISSELYMVLAFVQIYKLQFWFLSTIVTIIEVLLLFIIAIQIEHYRCGEKLWMLLGDYGMDIYMIGYYVQ